MTLPAEPSPPVFVPVSTPLFVLITTADTAEVGQVVAWRLQDDDTLAPYVLPAGAAIARQIAAEATVELHSTKVGAERRATVTKTASPEIPRSRRVVLSGGEVVEGDGPRVRVL